MATSGELYRFDKKRVGLTSPQNVEERRHLLEGAKRGARDVYDTSRVGHSNVGHDFYTDVDEATTLAVIEYLKTL